MEKLRTYILLGPQHDGIASYLALGTLAFASYK